MTLTNHTFGQMQHAEYESEVARHTSTGSTTGGQSTGWLLEKMAAAIQWTRKSLTNLPSEQLPVQS